MGGRVIDTPVKRRSALLVGTGGLPRADSTIDAGDRATLGGRYGGNPFGIVARDATFTSGHARSAYASGPPMTAWSSGPPYTSIGDN